VRFTRKISDAIAIMALAAGLLGIGVLIVFGPLISFAGVH